MATEPVTLLERLRRSLEYEEPWTPRDVIGLARVNDVDFVCDAMNALPAVVALIEAAQQVIDDGASLAVLRAALEPFVSTQEAAA